MRARRVPLVAVLVSLAISALLAQENESPIESARSHAIRLSTTEAGHGLADLQSLKQVIGDSAAACGSTYRLSSVSLRDGAFRPGLAGVPGGDREQRAGVCRWTK